MLDPTGVDLGQQQFLELLRTEWLHEHVRAGVHANPHLVRGQPADARIVRVGDLMDALPVRDDEATELELALEHVRDESSWACILSGSPTPSSIQSTLENDGITLRTPWRLIAVAYGARSIVSNSSRLVTVMPWSIV